MRHVQCPIDAGERGRGLPCCLESKNALPRLRADTAKVKLQLQPKSATPKYRCGGRRRRRHNTHGAAPGDSHPAPASLLQRPAGNMPDRGAGRGRLQAVGGPGARWGHSPLGTPLGRARVPACLPVHVLPWRLLPCHAAPCSGMPPTVATLQLHAASVRRTDAVAAAPAPCPAGLQRQVVYGGLRIGLYEPIRNAMVGPETASHCHYGCGCGSRDGGGGWRRAGRPVPTFHPPGMARAPSAPSFPAACLPDLRLAPPCCPPPPGGQGSRGGRQPGHQDRGGADHGRHRHLRGVAHRPGQGKRAGAAAPCRAMLRCAV